VFPGTVYNFGPDAFPLLSEHSPQRPLTRKGQIRVDMERRLEAAASNSWFSQGGTNKIGTIAKTLTTHTPTCSTTLDDLP
jgi:hypothetical protein